MAWLYILCAALAEMAWVSALKNQSLAWSWQAICVYAIAFLPVLLLNFALKTLPMGTTYSVFCGVAALGITAIGIMFFSESMSLPRLLCIGLIVAGVVGLKFLEQG